MCKQIYITNTQTENDWNIFWASVQTVKQIFNPENGMRLGEHQYVVVVVIVEIIIGNLKLSSSYQNYQSLSKPLWIDKKRFNGKESETIQEGIREEWWPDSPHPCTK